MIQTQSSDSAPWVGCMCSYPKLQVKMSEIQIVCEEKAKWVALNMMKNILFLSDVDFVTPLCSQLTYEGILDDTFGIQSGK